MKGIWSYLVPATFVYHKKLKGRDYALVVTMVIQTCILGLKYHWYLWPSRKLVKAKFPKKSDTTIQYRNKRGELKFKGSPSLKGTQTYPKRFGAAVSRLQDAVLETLRLKPQIPISWFMIDILSVDTWNKIYLGSIVSIDCPTFCFNNTVSGNHMHAVTTSPLTGLPGVTVGGLKIELIEPFWVH